MRPTRIGYDDLLVDAGYVDSFPGHGLACRCQRGGLGFIPATTPSSPAFGNHLHMLLKGCLNGARTKTEHPACPTTPDELARDAAAVVAAGITALHVHPRDEQGNETLTATHLGDAIVAIKEAVDVPVGVSTGAWFLPDPADRLRAIEKWDTLPDFASVNFHEDGAVAVARLLMDRGVGVEAGLCHEQAAAVLVDSELGDNCVRVLFEPMEQTVEAALRNVEAIERVTQRECIRVPRLLHGVDRTAWPLVTEAARRGWQSRIGIEDTLQRPDGTTADNNADLARIAAQLVAAR